MMRTMLLLIIFLWIVERRMIAIATAAISITISITIVIAITRSTAISLSIARSRRQPRRTNIINGVVTRPPKCCWPATTAVPSCVRRRRWRPEPEGLLVDHEFDDDPPHSRAVVRSRPSVLPVVRLQLLVTILRLLRVLRHILLHTQDKKSQDARVPVLRAVAKRRRWHRN